MGTAGSAFKQSSSLTDIMVVRISSRTISSWVQNPPVGHPDSHIQPCKLSHKKVGQLIVKAFGNFICAFCPIPLSRPAVLTAVPSLILLPHTLSIHLSRHSLHIQDLNEEQGYGGNVTIPVSVNNCSLILVFFSFLDNKRKLQNEKNGHQPRNGVGENVYGCWQIYCAAFPCYKLHHCLQTRARYTSANEG